MNDRERSRTGQDVSAAISASSRPMGRARAETRDALTAPSHLAADQWPVWHGIATRIRRPVHRPTYRVLVTFTSVYACLLQHGLPVAPAFRSELVSLAAQQGLSAADIDAFVVSLLPGAKGVM
jgi:hypothetical protein